MRRFSARAYFSQSGQLLVEIILVMGLFALILPALLTGFISSSEGHVQQDTYLEVGTILRETQESLRLIRENGWSGFAQNGTFHPVVNSGTWSLAANSDVIGDFTRSVVISDVYRDNSGQIASSGAVVDPSTKRVVTTISWTQPRPNNISVTQYFTRYLDNLSFTETLVDEFDDGTLETTAVANTSGGEVVLGAGGNGDWCQPQDHIVAEMDLPGSAAARDVKAIEGKAFTGTHSGSSGSFVEVGISNDSPPVLSNLNTILGYETNDVFIDENYAYVATGDVSKDLVIIDLNTNTEVGFFNDSYWAGTAKGIWVNGNVGYLTVGPKLHTIDLSSKIGERSELDNVCLRSNIFGICLGTTGYRLQVVGNYAYVALDSGQRELQLVNVTDPNNISRDGGASVNNASGQEVYVNETGTRVYLATSNTGSEREMFIINTTSKSGNLPVVGSYEANGMSPKGITVVPGNRAILVGTGGEEYQVINTTSESNPVRCGGFDSNDGIYGVSSVLEQDGEAYSYVVTADNSNELKAILGGPGGTGSNFYPEGTFESATFDAGLNTAFNRIDATILNQQQTTLTYQVSVAQAISGSCNGITYTFVGPDGTGSSFFEATGGAIPFGTSGGYSNPGRCFRYKAYLETEDSAFTPVLEDVTVNYSP